MCGRRELPDYVLDMAGQVNGLAVATYGTEDGAGSR